MAFIDYQQPEVTVRQVALDEFRRLIIALLNANSYYHGAPSECLITGARPPFSFIRLMNSDIVFEHRA
jgi:hypothetical protein